MRKLINPCGLHCIKINNIGVNIGEQVILHDVNLHVHCGNLVALIGKNGAGKSTLIRAILGDISHTGTIDLKDHENGNLQKMKIGYVPQKLELDKKTPVSVFDMLAAFQTKFPIFLKKRKSVEEKVLENLRIFKAEDLIDRQVCNLSGGELQRFCVARSLFDGTRFLLADEISTMLDVITQAQIWNFLIEETEKRNIGMVIVSHNRELLNKVCTRIVEL